MLEQKSLGIMYFQKAMTIFSDTFALTKKCTLIRNYDEFTNLLLKKSNESMTEFYKLWNCIQIPFICT